MCTPDPLKGAGRTAGYESTPLKIPSAMPAAIRMKVMRIHGILCFVGGTASARSSSTDLLVLVSSIGLASV